MPEWVMQRQSGYKYYYGVGYAKMRNDIESLRYAGAWGKNMLQDKAKDLIEEKLKAQYGEDFAKEAKKTIKDVDLSDAEIFDTWFENSYDTGVYVLVGIPVKSLDN